MLRNPKRYKEHSGIFLGPSGPKLSKFTWAFNVPLLPLSVVLLQLLAIGAVDDLVVQNAKTGGVLIHVNFLTTGPTEFLRSSLESWEHEGLYCWMTNLNDCDRGVSQLLPGGCHLNLLAPDHQRRSSRDLITMVFYSTIITELQRVWNFFQV